MDENLSEEIGEDLLSMPEVYDNFNVNRWAMKTAALRSQEKYEHLNHIRLRYPLE